MGEEQMQDTGMSQQEQQEFVQFLAQILQAKSTDELQSKLEVQTKKDPDFIKKAYMSVITVSSGRQFTLMGTVDEPIPLDTYICEFPRE